MGNSKAVTDPGDMDRHQKIIEFLQEQASLALESALEKKMPIVEAMRGDEVFFGQLVDCVIERLEARRMAGGAPISGARWAEALINASDRLDRECCPRCGRSRQGQ